VACSKISGLLISGRGEMLKRGVKGWG